MYCPSEVKTGRLLKPTDVSWVTRSICPRPTESSQACHGATIDGRSRWICGIEATNSAIDVVSAPATTTMITTRIATTPV